MPRRHTALPLLCSLLILSFCRANPPSSVPAQTTVDNLVAFSRLYGYVRHFHPSDAVYELDWDTFAQYGSERVADCQTPEALKDTLTHLFGPVAPTLVIGEVGAMVDSPLSPTLAPDSTYTFWQHQGVDLGANGRRPTYQSKRVTLRGGQLQDSLFDLAPDRVVLTEPLGSGLVCHLPLLLSTAVAADRTLADSLTALDQRLQTYAFDPPDRASQLGNVVITYNIFQHFYPYFDVVEVDWQRELRTALERSLTDESTADHLLTLRRMTATLQDGHIYVINPAEAYYPPLYWEWINDSLTVTKVLDDTLGMAAGDVVTSIDGRSVSDYFTAIWPTISAGTEGWREYRAQGQVLNGEQGSELRVEVGDRVYTLRRTLLATDYSPHMGVNADTFRVYDDGIMYVNLDLMSMPELDSLLPRLTQAEGLIFDLRGYPKGNHQLINHLMTQPDTTSSWMQVPQQVYPDQQEPNHMLKLNWMEEMQPKQPYLGDKPTVFLTDGRAISYAESFLAYIGNYRLATIMGQPTAGANGNVNIINLPGNLYITFTGMRVVKHDGSRLHGIGIAPDILVNRTVAAVRRGEDEYLTAALAHLRAGR